MKQLCLYILLIALAPITFVSGDVSLTISKQKIVEPSFDKYFEYLDRYPDILGPLGDFQKGEIEIIRDRQKMLEIEHSMGRRVGVVAEDNYWIWLNDVVRFPNGKYGIYGRMLWRSVLGGVAGVAVMPVLPNGKIVLNRNFRHATRSWEYELPRGAINMNETIQAAAIREAKEETGMVLSELYPLGQMAPDSGLVNTIVPIFMARVVDQQSSQPDDSEAIAAVEAFSVEELKKGFIDGYMTVEIDGSAQQIYLRDPFLAFALFQADARNLLTKEVL